MYALTKTMITKTIIAALLALTTLPVLALPGSQEIIRFAVSQDESHIFTILKPANESRRELHVLDTATSEITSKIPLPLVTYYSRSKPSLMVSQDGNKLYITDIDKKLYLVDIKNNSIERIKNKPKQDVGIEASSAMTLSQDGKSLYIADGVSQLHSPATLHILDTRTNTITATVAGNNGWKNGTIALDPNSAHLYISNQAEYYRYEISTFDTQAQRFDSSIIKLGYHVESMALNPLNGQLYLTVEDRILVVDPVSMRIIQEILPTDHDLHVFTSIAFALHGNKFYVADNTGVFATRGIMAFDLDTKTSRLILHIKWYSDGEIKVSTDGSRVYANEDNTIHVIDANSDLVIKSYALS